ncbi:hypothetical protein AX17_001988 [Amanita inopinata Kibby_2008]|nr:hypothetical protein AX17_001988 [Amanita inopinata Kibby_2008]
MHSTDFVTLLPNHPSSEAMTFIDRNPPRGHAHAHPHPNPHAHPAHESSAEASASNAVPATASHPPSSAAPAVSTNPPPVSDAHAKTSTHHWLPHLHLPFHHAHHLSDSASSRTAPSPAAHSLSPVAVGKQKADGEAQQETSGSHPTGQTVPEAVHREVDGEAALGGLEPQQGLGTGAPIAFRAL